MSSSEDHQTYIFSSMSPPIIHPYLHLSISPSPCLPLPFPPFIFLPLYSSLTLNLLIPPFPLYPSIFSSIYFFIPSSLPSSLYPILHSFTLHLASHSPFLCPSIPSFMHLIVHSFIHIHLYSSFNLFIFPSTSSIHLSLHSFAHPFLLPFPIPPPLHPSSSQPLLSTSPYPPLPIPLHPSFPPFISLSLHPLIESSQRIKHYQCVSSRGQYAAHCNISINVC